MLELIHALRSAIAARDEAARRHSATVAVVQRAEQALAAATAERDRLAVLDTEAVARAAKRLQAALLEGDAGALPQCTPGDRHVMQQLIAERGVATAKLALENLAAGAEQSAEDLRQAEAAVRHARNEVLVSRGREFLSDLKQIRSRERQLVAILTALADRSVPLPSEFRNATAPGARPDSTNMAGGPYLSSIQSRIGGEPELMCAARAEWSAIIEQLEREPAPDAPAEAS